MQTLGMLVVLLERLTFMLGRYILCPACNLIWVEKGFFNILHTISYASEYRLAPVIIGHLHHLSSSSVFS